MLDRALSFRHAGPYQLQAAIAAVHAGAEDARKTDWPRIAALIAMAEGTERGLALVDALGGSLDGYHLVPLGPRGPPAPPRP